MEKISIGIVAAEFNYDITFAMVELAKEHARFLDVDVIAVVRVPGVFDMPLVVKKLLQRDDIDGLVVLGAVIEGSTEHDEIVAQHAARKVADLALDYEKPIGLGITGPGMSRMEAHQRVGYAKRAVEAAVKMIKTIREIQGAGGSYVSENVTHESAYQTDGNAQSGSSETNGADPLDGFFKEFGGV
jgi:6,7-dimethyl-8-ribityllumazine synthase